MPCTCHSQEGVWIRTDLNMHKRQQTAPHLILKLVTEYTLKISNLEMGPKMESWLQDCLYRAQWILHPYRKPSYKKN